MKDKEILFDVNKFAGESSQEVSTQIMDAYNSSGVIDQQHPKSKQKEARLKEKK